MENELTAIVFGATGLVGSQLLDLLLADHRYTTVRVLHRRTTGIQHPKLSEHIIDFDDPGSWADKVQGDHLFLCLGTTIRKAGSEEAQYTIDYTYPHEAAQAARNNGVEKCAVVSSTGADPQSRGFYLRMKGELDEDLQKLGFGYLAVFRPSFLDGDRTEFRPAEKAGIILAKLLAWLPGIREYRPIPARTVAEAMISDLNTSHTEPCRIYERARIFDIAEN